MPSFNPIVESILIGYRKTYDEKFRDKDLIFQFHYWYTRLSLNISYLHETKIHCVDTQMLLVDTLRKIVDDIQMQLLSENDKLYTDIAKSI